ncbi:hypothetical protein KP509_32G076400 [Ceratopteris richardii]|uniref:non-specific serine/threonine protein kinase n=1 Tax=Ceratopteris richardii TaxID=49495 RepID=A0A8T2QW29_CERRI|nr:hypothetical protein KP509_32G076400 [Ceratopteris richardii]
MTDKNLRWKNQSNFLQARRGLDTASSSPEVITVALPFEDDQTFDLLCWTINMAARSGDSVIGLRRGDSDTEQKLISGRSGKSQVIGSPFIPLQELCNLKQVHLEMRVASIDLEEKLLVEVLSTLSATVLVVTMSGHNLKRHAHRRGNFLSRQLPLGCSVVVVKDYKILYYKENRFQELKAQKELGYADEAPALQLQPAIVTVRAKQLNTSVTSIILSPEGTETCSPEKSFLESSDAFCDSIDILSSNKSGSSHSLLREPLISHSSSLAVEEDIDSKLFTCFNIQRSNKLESSTHLFSSVRQHKNFKAWRLHFKSFMSNLFLLWPFKSLKAHMSVTSTRKPWKVLTYEEILEATDSFSQGNLVGKGGHSEVYRGILNAGEVVAVKRLIRCVDEQRTIDFLTEIGIICHAMHPNITPLIGYCIENGLYLVYKFMSHGNLAGWLYGRMPSALKWEKRFKVALGTARGLNYLHSCCQRRIIHRDIKASNILLGEEFEPQISDFGLAKWLPAQCSHHVLSPVEGTFGYLAPEYVMNGIVDEKTDVFAYGVLLLELITGRKPIEGLQSSLVLWARPLLESMDVEKLVDPQLKEEYNLQEMQSLIMVASLCLQQAPECRPFMGQVLQLLTDEQGLDTLDSFSAISSQSFLLQDAVFDSDYSSSHYQEDLRRHRELALEF